MNITELLYYSKKAYQESFDAGWYKDPETEAVLSKSYGLQYGLILSEVSEALEAFRKDEVSSKFGGPALPDELADVGIRLFDRWGYTEQDVIWAYEAFEADEDFNSHLVGKNYFASFSELNPFDIDLPDLLYEIARMIVKHQEATSGSNTNLYRSALGIIHGLEVAHQRFSGVEGSFYDMIDRKMEYNQNRADHKLENRQKSGGKKF